MRRLLLLGVWSWLGGCAPRPVAPPAAAEAAASVPPAGAGPSARQEGALRVDGAPPLPAGLSAALRPFEEVRTAALADVGPGGAALVLTRFADVAQVHRVAAPGAAREQLTFGAEPVAAAGFHPKQPSQVLFSRDVGGNENHQLHLLDISTGHSRLLTDGKSRHSNWVWDDAGARIALTGNARNGRDMDLLLLSPDSGAPPRLVKELDGSWTPLDFSPDGGRVLLQEYRSILDSRLAVLDLATGALAPVASGGPQPQAWVDAFFSADGASIVAVTDRGGEHRGLVSVALADGAVRPLSPAAPWDVEELAHSADRRTWAWAVNEDGRSAVWVQAAGGAPRRLDLPSGVIRGLAFDEKASHLTFQLSDHTLPGDVFRVALAGGTVERMTRSERGGLPEGAFTAGTRVRVPSFDGHPVPAWVLQPPGPGPHPVLILVHGGPESQSRADFHAFAQAMVRLFGVAVVLPDVRGSAGYGRTVLAMDDGRKREDAVKDIGALLDWVAAEPALDEARVGIAGGSYGGYMTLASLARHAGRLRCGADSVGIANFVTFLERTSPYRQDLRRAEYGDERDPEMRAFLASISPTTLVSAIRAPLLVAHGQNDPRVPVSEAEQIVAAVRANGGEAWSLIYADEGHGFRKQANRRAFFSYQANFFDRCLTGGAGVRP